MSDQEPDDALAVSMEALLSSMPPEPRSRFTHDFYYERVLEQIMPALMEAAPEQTLRLLCDLLVKCVELSLTPEEKEKAPPYDASRLWLSEVTLSDDDEPFRSQPKEWLAEALRKATLQIAEKEPSRIPAIIELLESRKYHIFQRIALHMLHVADEAPLKLIDERLTERDRFAWDNFWPEYSALLQQRFAGLEEEKQETFLDWIEKGPDIKRYRKLLEAETGQVLDPEKVQAFARNWRRKRAQALEDVLPESWKAAHAFLFEAEAAPAGPSPAQVSMKARMSEVKKLLKEDLGALSALLRQWSDLEAPPSREAVGFLIRQAAKQNPERFAREAGSFEGTDATFVRDLFEGLRDAAKSGDSFSWGPVLALGRWAVDQPREIKGRSQKAWHTEKRGADPHWGWARKALAELLEQGLAAQKSSCRIPYTLSEEVWRALKPLLSDPDPTPESDDEYKTDRAFNRALNVTRGRAMIAVMEYVNWRWHYLEEQKDPGDKVSMSDMPEAEKVLSMYLNPSIEPSPSIRAVYGRYFSMLVHLDAQWTRKNLFQLFPEASEHGALFEAAWKSYLLSGSPAAAAFKVARDVYARVVEEIGAEVNEEATESTWGAPQLRKQDRDLAAHLMQLYVWKNLKLDDELLERFFDVASDDLRGYALGHVGELLEKCVVPECHPEALRRCRALWEKRLRHIKEQDATGHDANELGAFGSWFSSGKLDEGWGTRQLFAALERGGKPERPYRVIEKLSEISCSTELAVRCANLLLLRDRQAGKQLAMYKRAELRTLFKKALREESAAAEVTRELISQLLARGIDHFRDLL